MFLNGFNRNRAALGLAHHGNEACLGQHHLCEFVHACGGGRACRAHGLAFDGVNRAHVVNHAVGEIDRQLFAFGQHVLNALVCSVAAGQHLAIEKQGLTGFPAGHFSRGESIQINALALFSVRGPVHVGPQIKGWHVQINGTRTVHHEVRVPGGCAVGNHGDRLAGGVRGVHLDFDVEHGGQAAQALRANAQGIDLFVNFQTHVFNLRELLALA